MASSIVVPVVEITNVREHPNASMLGLADVLGFQVVVGLIENPNGSIVRKFIMGKRDERGNRVPYIEGHDDLVEEIRFSFRHNNGDKAVYFPADTIISDELAEKLNVKHLLGGKEKNRVKRIALRGEPSFGLLVNIPDDVNWEIGYNAAEYFGAIKYEPPIRTSIGDQAAYDENIGHQPGNHCF